MQGSSSVAALLGRGVLHERVATLAAAMADVPVGLLLARLIESGALGDAVVVALPHDVRVRREGQQALDGLTE